MNILLNESIRKKMLSGIDQLADTVRITIGPKGRNVAMHQKANLRDADYSDRAQPGAHILITNDGATIARAIVLPDPMENLGAQLLKEAALKVNEKAGDGTSTAILLTRALLHEAFRNIAAGAEPAAINRGLRKASEAALRELSAMSRPAATQEEISKVATISCGDPALGELIGEAFITVGLEGVVSVDESRKHETTLDIQEGIVFERGFLAPFMATDELRSVAELRDPYILIADMKFSNPQDLLPALIAAAEEDRPCLIISDGVEGEALGMIQKNKQEGDLDIVCVEAPLYGEGRKWRMEDLAIQTGGTFITKDMGMDIRAVTAAELGTASYVKITRNQTMITGAGGDPALVENRIKELRYYVEHTDYEFNRERYRERLAKFVSGVAKIEVGGDSEPEIWERKMRVEDAVNAARAAYEEGILPGGGTALLRVIPALEALASTLSGDDKTGVDIVISALKAPVRQIADNAGKDGGTIVARLLAREPGIGYDADQDRYVDMMAEGIVDPAKVTRQALECALSVAGTVLMTEAGVAGKKKEEED